MSDDSPILAAGPLGTHFQTQDPFLFCAYHRDDYPAGQANQGPQRELLRGRDIGMDFAGRDGWSMYHGDVVPGFPQHPHRGFETITVTRKGYCDHADSLGATARFGPGDGQWMTAGKGIVHSEMFPLRERDADNPLELFQIWLNLPARGKLVPPHFTMLWREETPVHRVADAAGRVTTLTTFVGAYEGVEPTAPPPDSWASEPASHVAVWSLDLSPGARFVLPPAPAVATRSLYFHAGADLDVAGQRFREPAQIFVQPAAALTLQAGDRGAELLMLQGRPLGEPVAHHGPFVMNTRAELQQAFLEYQRTRFGGWPWDREGVVHPRAQGRFARHADGRVEERDDR
ncbi:MAG: pirin family protein [Myxococcota bacterium]